MGMRIGTDSTYSKPVFLSGERESNQTGGTGVGLPLTSSLIKLHYGTINIEDNPRDKAPTSSWGIPLGHEHLPINQLRPPLAQSSVPKHTTQHSTRARHQWEAKRQRRR